MKRVSFADLINLIDLIDLRQVFPVGFRPVFISDIVVSSLQFWNLSSQLGGKIFDCLCKLGLKSWIERRVQVIVGILRIILWALTKVVVAWIEYLYVLENIQVGDSAVKHCFRPGSSSTLRLEKPLQLQPELSLSESLWFLWVLNLRSFGTPDSLS